MASLFFSTLLPHLSFPLPLRALPVLAYSLTPSVSLLPIGSWFAFSVKVAAIILKKLKLQNHCRGCAVRKLSCIEGEVVFDQKSVQAHMSCATATRLWRSTLGEKASRQG